jgi:hypothetical protein
MTHTCIISILEKEMGGSKPTASPGESVRTYLKNKPNVKGLGMWLNW